LVAYTGTTASREDIKGVRTSAVEIKPTRGIVGLGLGELWRFRDLAYFFAWRDVKVRYKQTFFGGAWAIIQPLVLMVIFTFVFGTVLEVETPPGVPKPIFYYAGLVPWTLFAGSMSAASESLAANASLVGKIYFPRLILPLSAVGSSLVDFAVALTVLFVMVFAYRLSLSVTVLWLPLLTLVALLTALSVGVWLSALNARYRDVRYAIPFLVQVMLFVTPLINPASQVPESIRPFYFLNPMAGVVEGFRWALIDAAPAPGAMTLLSVAITVLLLVTGLFYFRSAERTFADVI
jgi:lipopolysaccharide transport system permease protein